MLKLESWLVFTVDEENKYTWACFQLLDISQWRWKRAAAAWGWSLHLRSVKNEKVYRKKNLCWCEAGSMSELDLISNAAATRQTPKEERGTGPEAATEQSTDVVTQVEWSSAPHSCSQEVGCDTPARRPGLSRLDWSPEREQSVGTSSLTHREPTPYSYSLPSSWKHNETQATVHSFWILLLLNIFKLVEQTTV